MKSEHNIKKGNVVVIKNKGKILFVKEAKSKGLRIDGNSDYTVEEKAKAKLTKTEKEKLK